MIRAKDVRERYSVLEIAEELGLEIDANDKTFCVLHDENTPSLQLYDDHWYAYCCGEGGSVIDLVMAYFGCDFRRAIDWIVGGDSEDELESRPVVVRPERATVDFTLKFRAMVAEPTQQHFDMVEQRWPYLFEQGAMPGWPVADGWAFPHIHGTGIPGIKYRLFDGSKTSEPGSTFTTGLFVPYGQFPEDPEQCTHAVICEGETDAYCLQVALGPEVAVYGLPSGAGLWKPDWVSGWDLDLVVVMDNDKAGRAARDKIVSSGVRCEHMWVPEPYNDAADALADGWTPAL